MRNKLLRMGFAAVMAAVLAGCSFGPQPAAVEESVSSQMTEEEFVQELEELPLLVAANALPEDQLFQTADFRFYTQQDSFATYDIWQLEQCQQELAALVLGEEVTDPAQMERLSQASQEVWIYGDRMDGFSYQILLLQDGEEYFLVTDIWGGEEFRLFPLEDTDNFRRMVEEARQSAQRFVQGRDVFTAPAGELTAIGETGILHWMEAYTSQDVVTWYRMDNCQAQQVSLVAGDASEFCVSARLSYQSYSPAHLSANGLGQQLEGGAVQWDDCYTEFRIVARGGDQYEILTTGTGGGGQGLVPADEQGNLIPPAAPTVMNEQKAAQLLAKPEEFQSQALAYGYVTEVPGKTVNLALAEQWADGSQPGELVYLSAGEKPAVYVFVRDDRPGYTICWYNAEGFGSRRCLWITEGGQTLLFGAGLSGEGAEVSISKTGS